MNQNFFVGIVESRNDPLFLGRVQVRVFGVHSESLDDVPTEDLPWAISLMPATSASLSGIGHSASQYIEGTMVFLFFQDGDSKQQPIILGSAHGIPLSSTPFSNDVFETQDVVSQNTGTSTVQSTTAGTLQDSSGATITDSTGTPVQAGSDEKKDGLDISRMVAKFGSNVTLVFNTLAEFGIKEPHAVVAILSNIAKECKFKPQREGMKYSSVDRLRAIFPSKFRSMPDATANTYVNDEVKLANFVYANSDGNGSESTGDGYNYRGGGFIQLTKKNNYKAVGSKINVDLVGSPDKVNDPAVAAKVVAQYFVNRFGGANKLSFSNLEDALTTVTKKVNPGGFNNDYPKVKEYSLLCTINGEKASKAAETAKEISKPNDPENDIKKDATQTEINAGIVGGRPIAKQSALGFKDPKGKYPLKNLLKEQDTNRLARRNTTDTIIDTKTKNRRTGIRSIGSTFNEPAAPYNALYPYNHVYASESGHLMEFDDTPGNERVQTYHTSGTYSEVDKFGNRTNKIIGDDFTIIERNGYLYVDGALRMTIGGDVKLVVGGNLDIEVDGNLNYNVGGDVVYKVGGDMKSGIGGTNSQKSGGDASIDGSNINLNSGKAEAISPSARTGESEDYAPQIPENFRGANSLEFDEAPEADVVEHHKKLIEAGVITQKELDDGKDAKPTVVDETPPKNDIKPVPMSCEIFKDKTSIPDTTQLSKFFTLGMLSSKAVVSRYPIKNQHGLTIAEIACNLKKLAENCLDPIKVKYPKMFVTSAFRVGNGKSQHERGLAADMQFTGASKSDFFEIAQWIRDNVAYDQLLLEYKTTGTGNPWIHISFNSDGNRKAVMTFMNDKSTGTGLRKLQA